MTPEMVFVEARTNVLDLKAGEQAWLPVTADLLECLARQLVIDLNRPPPTPLQTQTSTGCGNCG